MDKEILKDIKKDLNAGRDDGRAIKMATYMKDHFGYLGIGSPLRKKIVKDHLRRSRMLEKTQALRLVSNLWQEACREYQYVAMDILDLFTRQLTIGDLPFVESLVTTKSWWDTVDHLAAHQLGHILQGADTAEVIVEGWLISDNIWLNRCCLLYQLFYKERTNWEALQSYIHRLQHKKEFFIQKAIGWSLRQYSKTDAQAVSCFIRDNTLSSLAEREGMKWISKNVK